MAISFDKTNQKKQYPSHKNSVCLQISQVKVVIISLKFTQLRLHYHKLDYLLNLHYICSTHATNQKDFYLRIQCGIGGKKRDDNNVGQIPQESEHSKQSQDHKGYYQAKTTMAFGLFIFILGECVLRSISIFQPSLGFLLKYKHL